MQKIGHYSGSKRLDTSNFEEPDKDTERSKDKWLSGKKEIKIGGMIRRWKRKISEYTDPDKIKVHLVGQSHIDCAWMWRFEQTRKKAQVTFRKAILHADMFPNSFCFALSEPLLLEWIKDDDPKLFKEIQKKVKGGNIELVGGSYVEPDCMMPSGEAMIRQRLYGMRFYRDHFNYLPSVEWFLDSFGYNFGLPQILVKSGAKFFWTNKLAWNMNTTFPFVNFWWQSPDGSRILASHFFMDKTVLEVFGKYQIGRHLLKSKGRKIWDYTLDYNELGDHVQEQICPHVGCFFGLGDGGHGPTHKEVAYANEMAKNKMFQWSKVRIFFNEVEKLSNQFPIWNDELYLENHRGCFSNHAEVKRYNRKFENLFVSLEVLAVLISLQKKSYQYPQKKFEYLWKILLKNQFHDVLPGSSIPEVYDECWDDWKMQNKLVNEIYQEIGNAIANQKVDNDLNDTQEILLFNPHTWEKGFRVFIPISVFNSKMKLKEKERPNYAKLEILNSDNKEYICQPIEAEPYALEEHRPAGWWVVIRLKPLSLTLARIKILDSPEGKTVEQQNKFKTTEKLLENDLMSIRLNPKNGALLSLNVRGINENNNLIKGDSSNLTFSFLDDDRKFPAWNLTPEYWNFPLNYSNEERLTIKVSNIGPIFATLEINRILGSSPVTQKITLFQELPEIFMDYITDWKDTKVMLKILYSTRTKAENVTADGMYCAVKSKTNPEVPCDIARFEKICHEYIDLSSPDNTWGLAMLNEGKYAFDVKGGDIRLTLLRSCRYPDPAPEAWVNEERIENEEKYNHKVPQYSGLGPFICRYALLPHKGGALINPDGTPNVVVKQSAKEFNKPIMVIPLYNQNEKIPSYIDSDEPILQIMSPNVYLGVMKYKEWDKEKSIILRFYEGSGIPMLAKVQFNTNFSNKIARIKPVDLLEREIEYEYNWYKEKGSLEFSLNKFEISTFEIYLS